MSSSVLVINAAGRETRVALVEQGHIAEFYLERKKDKGIVGNIYKGRVTRVLPGMQAAFVDIGEDKAAFLYVGDVLFDPEVTRHEFELTEGEHDEEDDVPEEPEETDSVVEAAPAEAPVAEVAPEAAETLAEGDDAPASNRFEKLINIKDRGQIFRVDVDTIERIDAAGDYMCIYTGDNTLILRETMKDLEKRLDPRRFQRVHRSTIVNLDLVREVKPHTNGECFLVLGSGAQVKVSRSYRDVVARFVH